MSIPGPASPVVLSLSGVSKAFGAVQALRDVSFDCRAGEVHALVGENGSREIDLAGHRQRLPRTRRGQCRDRGADGAGAVRRPRRARFGLGIAYQTYSHVNDLSVAENLYLAVPKEVSALVWRDGRVGGARLAEFKLDLPVQRGHRLAFAGAAAAPRGREGAPGQAEGAPARRADDRARLEEVERLHALVLERSQAGVGIVYVSHRLPEVLGIADRVTVLRDGAARGRLRRPGWRRSPSSR